MIIEFEGRTWDIDPTTISVDEWRELKRKYRMSPKQWEEGIGEADPDASTFLYWIMLRRSGMMTAILGDDLKPDILALNAAISVASAREEKEAAERKAAEAAQAPPANPTSPPVSAASPALPTPSTMSPVISPPTSAIPGSGTATSTSSGSSTSVPSPTTAAFTNPTSAGSP